MTRFFDLRLLARSAFVISALIVSLPVSARVVFFDDDIRAEDLNTGALVFATIGGRHWTAKQPDGRKERIYTSGFHMYVRRVGSDVGLHFWSVDAGAAFLTPDLMDSSGSISVGGTFIKPGTYELYGFSVKTRGGAGAIAQSTMLTFRQPRQFEVVKGKAYYLGRFLLNPVVRHVYPPAEEDDPDGKLRYARYHVDAFDIEAGSCLDADSLLLGKPWPESQSLPLNTAISLVATKFDFCEKPLASSSMDQRTIPENRWKGTLRLRIKGLDFQPEFDLKTTRE